MEIVDQIVNAFSELLIENMTMKDLLRETAPDLERLLSTAKSDPDRKQVVEDYLAPLRSAITDEVEFERRLQELTERMQRNPGKHN